MRNTIALGSALLALLVLPALAIAETQKNPEANAPQHPGFAAADTNHDGSLSLDEFLARHKEKFSEMDTNKDGSLSPDELKARGAAIRERREDRKEMRMERRGDTPPPAGGSVKPPEDGKPE